MNKWNTISKECYEAARILIDHGHFRSSVNRSYYAMYAAITSALISKGFSNFGATKRNPSHTQAFDMYSNHLLSHKAKNRELRSTARRVRMARVNADYMPGITTDKTTAKNILRDAMLVINVLQK